MSEPTHYIHRGTPLLGDHPRGDECPNCEPAYGNCGGYCEPGPAPQQRAQKVADLIAKWQDRLGLSGWEIRYNPDGKPDKGKAAGMTQDLYLHLCQIVIAKDCPDSELEACVLHEMLHIVTGPLGTMTKQLAGAIGDERTGPLLLDNAHDAEERLIELLVTALTGRKQRIFGKRALKHLEMFAA